MSKNLADLREEYSLAELSEESLDPNPFFQFEKWFEEARLAEVPEPNAMVLATVDPQGKPWTRTVLVKAFDESGLVFYTNYSSLKARQIEQHSQVSVTFPWFPLQRQLHITGSTEKVSRQQSLKYFLSRPHGSQLGAWVSDQSKVISSRQVLEMKLAEIKKKFSEGKVPLPENWGGIRILPETFEFWQGRRNRLHDRLRYKKVEGNWEILRLAP